MNIHSMIVPSPPEPAKAAAILDAALTAFGERGFGNTPVPALAARAGVAAGTIYRYFPGKRGVVNALYQRWKSRLGQTLLDGIDDKRPARLVFHGLWRRLVEFAVQNPGAFLFLETHHHTAYLDDDSKRLSAELDLAITDRVRAWQAQGEIREGDPELLVALVYGGLVGVVRHRNEYDTPLTPRLYEETVDAAWALLAPPRKDPS